MTFIVCIYLIDIAYIATLNYEIFSIAPDLLLLNLDLPALTL